MKSTHLASRNRLAPIAFLVFISPVLTELLMGSLQLSNLWLLLPEMGVYGFAALIIRELTRRRGRGWGTLLLLGIAFAIAEECVILQTSLTPQFFPPADQVNFGWVNGVEWVYLSAMLWYESVYAIVLPVTLTELLFPERRDEPWLGQRGLKVSATILLLSSASAWYLFRYNGLQKYGPSSYQVPWAYVGLALIAIAVLVSVTLLWHPSRSVSRASQRAWSPWLVGLLAFVHGLAWFVLIGLAYFPASALPGVSPLIPIGMGLAWVGLALLVVRTLSRSQGWGDSQRLALIFGASLASMLGGVLAILSASPLDQVGKLVFDLIAILLFAGLARRLGKRATEASRYSRSTALDPEA